MKKLLMCLTVILSFVGVNKVSAKELFLTDTTAENFTQYKEMLGNDNFNAIINDILDEYKRSYISAYPYFIISPSFTSYEVDDNKYSIYLDVELSYYEEVPTLPWSYSTGGSTYGLSSVYTRLSYDGNVIYRRYYIYDENGDYSFDINNFESFYSPYFLGLIRTTFDEIYTFNPYKYYMSNFDLYLNALNDLKGEVSGYIWDYDELYIPKLGEESLYNVVSFSSDSFLLEPYYLYDENVEVTLPNYTEINLNDYAYVALALKNYNQDSFTSTVQVKGQYCITPVYDFGLKSYDSITNNRVTNICSPYYENYTPVVTYITSDNLKNNSIYYVKSYDDSKDNYIKVDTNVFDISYINIGEENNPYVSIQGKLYPTIAYDSLPSSATQNTEEGYIPGESVPFDPIGTAADTFADIFSAPLEFLKDIFSSIKVFFTIITDFISLLPPVLQNFLYASFILAIVLGLIKIIL